MSVYDQTTAMICRTLGAGPSLVLLHGWGLNSGVWEAVLPALAKKYSVTIIDLPGFGQNYQCVPEVYSLDSITAMVLEHIPNNSTVLGWSLGGLVAQKLALKHSSSVSKMIGVATTPCFQQQGEWRGIKANVLTQFEKQLELDFHKTLSRFLAIQALGSPNAKQEIKHLQQAIEAYPSPAIDALRGGLRILAEQDLRVEAHKLDIPALFIYGKLDSLVPVASVKKMQLLYSNADHKVVEHAAHAPFISHPNEWLALIYSFMEQQ